MLSQPSDISDLVPSCLVSTDPMLSPKFCHITNCLSQVYSCSDQYRMPEVEDNSSEDEDNSNEDEDDCQ